MKQRSNAHALLREDPVVLSSAERQAVHHAIEERAAKREWKLLALNVRTNHVHCVIQASDRTPERVMSDLKSAATRALREAGLRSQEARIWTEHGSTRWIDSETSMNAAMEYVLNQQ